MIFLLNNDEKSRLQRLNQQKEVVIALKKLFLNTALKGTIPDNVQTLAAERVALDIIQDAFRQLETMQPEIQRGIVPENLV